MPALFALSLSFLAGVLLTPPGRPWGPEIWAPAGGLITVLLAAAAIARDRRVGLALLAVLVATVGFLYAGLHAQLAPGPLAGYADQVITLEGVVAREPEVGDGRVAAVIRAVAVRDGGARVPLAGLVRVTGVPPALLPGDKVVVTGALRRPSRAGNPGELDARLHHAARGVHWFLHPARGAAFTVEDGGPSPGRWLAQLREWMRAGIQAVFPPPVAAFYRTITLGDRPDAELPAESFRRAGVAHLLAISGLHVSCVAMTAAALARRLPLHPLVSNALVSLVTGLYVLLAGARAPALRAGIMALAVAWAVPLHRRHDPLAAVGLAALVIVGRAPAAVYDPGFQLSFAATLGLVVLAGPLERRLPRRLPGRRALAVAGAAQLGVLPLLLYHYSEVATLALVANLALVPLAGVAVPVGLAGSVAGGMAPGTGWAVAGRLAAAPAGLLLEGVALFARLPPLRLPAPSAPVLAGMYLGLSGWLTGRRRLAVLLLAALVTWGGALALPAGRLEVVFIDVGQGDAILIRSPSGRTALIDGGGVSRAAIEAGVTDPGRRVVALLRRLGVRRVDLLLLTHPHADHAGGLVTVIESLPVGVLLEGGPAVDAAPEYQELQAAVERAGIPRRLAGAGDRISLGRGRAGEVFLEVLWPGPGDDHRPANDRSLVLRLRYGETAFLLTGDVGVEVERALLTAGANLAAGVLKVGHHGSDGGTSREFLAAVGAVHAVISCGRHNPHGHPAPAVLARLAEAGVTVWRTDRHGAIRFGSDGRRLTVRPTLRRPEAGQHRGVSRLARSSAAAPLHPVLCWREDILIKRRFRACGCF